MAVPNDRRIVYGAFVVPQQSYSTTNTQETTEEGYTVGRASYTKYKVDTGVGKTFGGKSTGDHVQVTHDQASDEWTSMIHMLQEWDTLDDLWSTSDAVWGSDSGNLSVTYNSGNGSVIRSGSAAVIFLYIKNIGSQQCELSLEGPEWDMLIPAGAAVSMRTTSSVTCATVKVKTASSTTTIEYIIAI